MENRGRFFVSMRAYLLTVGFAAALLLAPAASRAGDIQFCVNVGSGGVSTQCDTGTQTNGGGGVTQIVPTIQCNNSATASANCPKNSDGAIASSETVARLDSYAKASLPIDVFNECRYVDNVSGNSHPVFFNSPAEYDHIIGTNGNHVPPDFVISPCVRPLTPVIPAGPACGSPVLKQGPTRLPYSHVTSNMTAAVVETAVYSCTNTGTGCSSSTSWTETATVTYLPSQASPDLPQGNVNWISGWTPTGGVAYNDSGAPAACGVCGTANGVAVTSAPTINLCSAGNTASAVSGAGPWSWTCTASSGGGVTSCSAPVAAVNGACGSAGGSSVTSVPTTGLCAQGTASAVTGTGPWNWTCTGSSGGTNASCSADKTALACDGTVQGQAECPTNSCFFYVSGLLVNADPAKESDVGFYQTIGEVNLASMPGYATGNLVGAGNYPYSYLNPGGSHGPFYNASTYTFDGMAIGNQTQVIIHDATNFGGNVIANLHGPLVINNMIWREHDGIDSSAWGMYGYGGDSTSWITANWSQFGSLYDQFPSSTRVWSDQVGATDKDMQHWGGGGACNNPPCDTGAAGGSVEVICNGVANGGGGTGGGGTGGGGTGGGGTGGGTRVDGVCGSDNGMTLSTAPTNECAAGTPSVVVYGNETVTVGALKTTYTYPLTWTCAGSNGGTTASCSATEKIVIAGGAGGGGGGGGCFAAGAEILMADGSTKDIEDIKEGDLVMSFDPLRPDTKLVPNKVAATVSFENKRVLRINDRFTVTPDHKFPQLDKKRYRKAGEFHLGDKLIAEDGSTIEITKMEFLDEPTKVYNFEVEHLHAYVVNGIRTNNMILLKKSIRERELHPTALSTQVQK